MNSDKYIVSAQSLEHLLILLSEDITNQPKEVQELFYYGALRRFSFFWVTFLSEIILNKDINFTANGTEHPFAIIRAFLVQEQMLSQEEAEVHALISELCDTIAFYEPNTLIHYEEAFKELRNQAPFMKAFVEKLQL